MSEELIQRNVLSEPEKMGEWTFYNLGATSLKELKAAKLIPNYDYGELEKKKPDAVIVKKPHIIAVIEYKTPQELRTKAQIKAAVKQEIDVAAVLHAKAYIVTDGTKSFWINPANGNEIMQEDGSRITLNFDRTSLECIKLLQKICASISADNDKLLPIASVDPLPLARQVWQDLWAVSGATPENCLYTFVEIFIFKYLSDLGVLTGMYSFYHLIAQYGENNTDESILTTYAANIRPHIKKLFPANPKDRTTIINGTIFVSKDDEAVEGYATVFRRILERFSEFGSLENIDYDFKSKLFETFLKQSISKKNWGQYFTPLKVVRSIVRMVDLAPGMTVCDPACGVGKFLLELVLNDLPRFYAIDGDTLNPQITLVGLDKGFDKEEQKTIILAKANMLIYLSALLKEHHSTEMTKQFAQLFNDTFLLQTNSILGTLAHPENEKYDLILTNPPYVMSGSSNLKEEIGKSQRLKKHYSVSALGIEGLFMEWIVRALKPGGKAFIVVPDGLMNRGNDKKMRDFILEHCNLDGVISLPLNTFFTTNKKTYIVALTKKIPARVDGVSTLQRQTTPVFTYFCSEIGETRDMYRFDMEQNDLEQATRLFNMFKGAKEHFLTEDKRCKIVGIDAFYEGSHWCVERWWSKEERIELGIEDDKDEMDISSFRAFIEDASNALKECEAPFDELIEAKKKSCGKEKTVNLIDEEHFAILSKTLGKNRTLLEQMDTKNPMDIPVFTAGKIPVAYIKDFPGKAPILASNDSPVFSFATNGDGSAGRNFILHTTPFYINTDRIAIKAVRADIKIPYVMTKLLNMKEKYGFNHANKANVAHLSAVTVDIPVSNGDAYDMDSQEITIQLANCYDETIRVAKEYLARLRRLKVLLAAEELFHVEPRVLSDLFKIERGRGKYTRTYVENHKGEYLLFSGNTFGEFAQIDSYDYDVPCLSWTIDGLAGYMMVHNAPFSATNHRGVLIPKTEHLDLHYMKYILEPLFRSLRKGREGDQGQNEYTSLPPFMIENVQVGLPVDEDGTISLIAQQKIAKQYLLIEQCKKEVADKLNALIQQKVSF